MEELHDLEELALHQQRVYPDSEEKGVFANDVIKGRKAGEWLREIIHTLLRLPGSEIYYRSDGPKIERSYLLQIDEKKKIRILYVNDRPNKKDYFSIIFLY